MVESDLLVISKGAYMHGVDRSIQNGQNISVVEAEKPVSNLYK